jgi:hypothetical protein
VARLLPRNSNLDHPPPHLTRPLHSQFIQLVSNITPSRGCELVVQGWAVLCSAPSDYSAWHFKIHHPQPWNEVPPILAESLNVLILDLSPKKPCSRAQTILNHQRAFRYVWRPAEQLYAGKFSSVVSSTIGIAILSPAFEDPNFDVLKVDESTNIAEALILAAISRSTRNLIRVIMIGDPDSITTK